MPMGPLQPGIPNPALIPKHWAVYVIDLKDCFFTIPLQDEDKTKFAFTIPEYNHGRPTERYQWRVLPQGMLNSPTLCQEFVDRALQPVREKFPSIILYHYTDEILIASEFLSMLEQAFVFLQTQLTLYGLQLAPEKIQKTTPLQYLGYKVQEQTIRPQKISIRTDCLKTLNDFQKLLGDINWLRPALGIPTSALSHLFHTLEGDPALDSPRSLSPEAKKELALIEQRIEEAFLDRIHANLPLDIIVFHTPHSPTAVVSQENALIEWLFLSNKQTK